MCPDLRRRRLPAPGARIVVLAEDDRDTLDLYSEFLSGHGFFVEAARTGDQAIDKTRRLKPAVVVTDLGLPGMDGFELCRRLKSDERTSRIPVIAVTGHCAADLAEQAIRAGIHQVLEKPCLPDRLLEAISRILDDTQYRFRARGRLAAIRATDPGGSAERLRARTEPARQRARDRESR
jgi:two-component system, cell cycle response regulator DivK